MKSHRLALLVIIGFIAVGGMGFSFCADRVLSQTSNLKEYANRNYRFALSYPGSWVIENKSWGSVLLVPGEAAAWQPSVPGDIGKSPYVRIEMGVYIAETLGPEHFPSDVNPHTLRKWLETKVREGGARGLRELNLGGIQAFEVTETSDPGCARVTYWRATKSSDLIRISTGCESRYLREFEQIVRSLRELDPIVPY